MLTVLQQEGGDIAGSGSAHNVDLYVDLRTPICAYHSASMYDYFSFYTFFSRGLLVGTLNDGV